MFDLISLQKACSFLTKVTQTKGFAWQAASTYLVVPLKHVCQPIHTLKVPVFLQGDIESILWYGESHAVQIPCLPDNMCQLH